MIRYHSFYPWHRENAYRHLMNEDDEAQLAAVRAFNRESRFSCPTNSPQPTTSTPNPMRHPRSPTSRSTTRASLTSGSQARSNGRGGLGNRRIESVS